MKLSVIWKFTNNEKELILSFLEKGKAEQINNDKFAIIDFESFYSLFTSDEITVMKKYLAINPSDIGYKLPFIGAEDTPSNIVPLPNQIYTRNGIEETIPCQYLPKQTFDVYQRMNEAIQKELNKKLLVLYGYRSPARQVFIFFDILERIYQFDLDKTVKRVCFPDYSEHVCPQRQAIDFITAEGVKGEEFENTDEYVWLQKNAVNFDFYQSYPRDNKLDMMFEPWHWAYANET